MTSQPSTSPSPLAPLKEIEAVRITAEDIEDESVLNIYQDFEDAWVKFLLEDCPDNVVVGATADRIQELQKKAKAGSESKAKLEKELKEQMNTIKKSRKELEREYSPLLDAEKAKQDRLKESIEGKINLIQDSIKTMEDTAPFLNFLRELDRTASDHDDNHRRTTAVPPIAKPSLRAMALANTTTLDDPNELAKACKIDNALYRAQIIALQNEIERYETILPLLEEAGQFLTEQNVWKIMKEGESKES